MLRQFAKVAVLRLAVIKGDLPNNRTTALGGLHMLGAAAAVFLNEFVRCSNDLLGGTVILLHIENFCVGINGVKPSQRLRIGGPETIDALVLISHHEEIPALSGQQANDRMLDLGGILSLVHAKIPIAGLDGSKDVGILAQDLKSVDHLVVIIHQLTLPQHLTVGLIKGGEVDSLHVQLRQLFPFQHLIFGIGNGSFQTPDGAL